ncbi:MAG: hypothetical protein KAS02_00215 [Candidatus Pacebacteria bacterium]|nr:hypothetical protein [Candidatus Paceibacterota bacterium]
MNFDVDSNIFDQKEDHLKTRIESLDFSSKTKILLKKDNILTVRGLLKRTEKELKNKYNLSRSNIDITLRKLNFLNSKIKNKEKQNKGEISDISDELDLKNCFEEIYIDKSEDVLEVFSNWFGFDEKIIKSKSRKSEIVDVRDLIIYFLREYGELSFPYIGELLGGRDHTTIIYAYNKIKKKIKNIRDFEKKFLSLIKESNKIKEKKEYIKRILIPIIEVLVSENNSKKGVKMVSERNNYILQLYREGLILDKIGKKMGISRERVRQIVKKTIVQLAINKSVSTGAELNFDFLIEDEKRKRKETQLIANPPKIKTIKKRYWSRDHRKCKMCERIIYKHVSNGLCEECTGSFRGKNRENIILLHENKCDLCDVLREEAKTLYKRDLYIMRNKIVCCRDCFLKLTGKTLGSYKNYEWSRFYPQCKKCGTKDIPHAKLGLCEECCLFLSDSQREKIIQDNKSVCCVCGISRDEAKSKFKRDLHIWKNKKTFCRKCHLVETGKVLSDYRKNNWKKFYKNY